jgi:hypothetical protein
VNDDRKLVSLLASLQQSGNAVEQLAIAAACLFQVSTRAEVFQHYEPFWR